jgi:hypothetical protein
VPPKVEDNRLSCVCGVDVGTLQSLSYVAWLRGEEFVLDVWLPSAEAPLPPPPPGFAEPAYVGFDAPQGLPGEGRNPRQADLAAKTPTKRLPRDRNELADWKLYHGLIEAGVEIFWSIWEQRIATVLGLPSVPGRKTTVFETYPRYLIRLLWPDMRIPSKRKSPLEYIKTVWGRIEQMGYRCDSVVRPVVDHVDAMLCALAARTCMRKNGLPAGTVGIAPQVDEEKRVLREGLIVGVE